MAKGFGEYSGVCHTPHALSWLIKQHKRVSGQIIGVEKDLRELPLRLEGLPARLQELREQLAAIEKTMAAHEIKVDPAKIRPAPPRNERLVPYGHLARTIIDHLKEAGRPQSTTELSVAVAKAHEISLTRSSQHRVRRCVIAGLNDLRKRGYITSVTIEDANGEKAWSLLTQTGSHPLGDDLASNLATTATRRS
jgi:hypothetical protein